MNTPAPADDVSLPAHRCIKPNCPVSCNGCNHAIPGDDVARMLVVRLLDEFGNDDRDGPYEEGEHPLIDEARAFLCSPPADRARSAGAAPALDREALIDLIARHLGDTYHCTRVWQAWNVGTMSEDDFTPVDESETPAEIADAILAMASPATPPTEPAPQPEQACTNCGGTGEYLAHALTCNDGLCAINGDEHSCAGLVERCGCATPQPEQAQAAQRDELLGALQNNTLTTDQRSHLYLMLTETVSAQAAQVVPESLHTFLDAAAGDGIVIGGVDAADLYEAIFPERYAAALAQSGLAATTGDPK